MFDLDLAIEQWKDTIGSLESIRTDDVLELESHLRSLVSELSRGGLAESEAFIVATHRLGKPAELNSEYAKVHGATVWQKRVLWMLCGYVAYSIGSAWINAIATFASMSVAMAKWEQRRWGRQTSSCLQSDGRHSWPLRTDNRRDLSQDPIVFRKIGHGLLYLL